MARALDLSTHAIDAFLAATLGAGDDLVDDLASEVRLACRLLATLTPTTETRILEVGAGAGVLAAFLYQQGANLVAIEPAAAGFEEFARVRARLPRPLPIQPLAATELKPAEHGLFDLIFSINVLEHMQPLRANLDALASVLAPGGRMLHTCPNYRVPYEPHYRIPLVPVRPELTGILARRAHREAVWRSLNWITAGDVARFARRHDLSVRFRSGGLRDALDRLENDAAFARRQEGPIVGLLRLLDRTGVADLLARVPPAWMTPMTFEIAKPPAHPSESGTPAKEPSSRS